MLMKETTNTFGDFVQRFGLGDGSAADSGVEQRLGRKSPGGAAGAAGRKGLGGQPASVRAGRTSDGYTARVSRRGTGRVGVAPDRADRIGTASDRGCRRQPETFFCRAHVSRGDWLRLRRGQISPDHTLDLHGVQYDHCQALVADFLAQLPSHRGRCLRLIHGKGLHSQPGAPTLKHMLQRWLPSHPAVLALCPRPDADGRSGSMDILLKIRP